LAEASWQNEKQFAMLLEAKGTNAIFSAVLLVFHESEFLGSIPGFVDTSSDLRFLIHSRHFCRGTFRPPIIFIPVLARVLQPQLRLHHQFACKHGESEGIDAQKRGWSLSSVHAEGVTLRS
jgi:hypothetical protein